MVSVWPSKPGCGQQMAEVVLATALALPVIFAFAELRGTQLAGTATEPQLADTPPNSSATSAAERPSPDVRVILSGGSGGEASAWESRLAVLMEAINLATRDASETPVKTEAEPQTNEAGEADKSPDPLAERVPLTGKDGRLIRPSPARVSQTPSEPMQ